MARSLSQGSSLSSAVTATPLPFRGALGSAGPGGRSQAREENTCNPSAHSGPQRGHGQAPPADRNFHARIKHTPRARHAARTAQGTPGPAPGTRGRTRSQQ